MKVKFAITKVFKCAFKTAPLVEYLVEPLAQTVVQVVVEKPLIYLYKRALSNVLFVV